MNGFKEKSVKILCKLGKYGMGKSLTLGMYDFEIPKKLIECDTESTKARKIMSETVCK